MEHTQVSYVYLHLIVTGTPDILEALRLHTVACPMRTYCCIEIESLGLTWDDNSFHFQ